MTPLERGVRDFHAGLLRDESDEFSAWNILKEQLLMEVYRTRGVRLTSKDEAQFKKMMSKRTFVTQVRASELFPDRNPPEIIKARSEVEVHNDLRARFPSQEPRLSGEIVESEVGNFFLFDTFFVKLGKPIVPTQASFAEIISFVLDQGLIPVDAGFNIIPPPQT